MIFEKDPEGLIQSVSKQERTVLGADLNGHVGEGNTGDEEIMESMMLEQEKRKDRWL